MKEKDYKGRIYGRLRYVRIIIYRWISTEFTKIFLILRGVEYKKNLKLYGLSKFIRTYNSKISIGNNCAFRSDFTSNLVGINRKCLISTLRPKAEIIIGDNSGFSGTVIASAGKITIGNNVLCGANTTITDFDWHGINPKERNNREKPKSVVIKDNVWLGLNVVVLKGVTIGENSVIGANSLVNKSIPANVIAAGNPCKVIREIIET